MNRFTVKKITAKEAYKLAEKLGLDICGEEDGQTFYATNVEELDVWEFDNKRERDAFILKVNNQ